MPIDNPALKKNEESTVWAATGGLMTVRTPITVIAVTKQIVPRI